jgi:hypothetical protein
MASAESHDADASPITDPLRIVAAVYQQFIRAQSSGDLSFTPSEDFYTPRLSKLVRDDRKRANGEVGCVDFDFWVNGQDWSITHLALADKSVARDRKTVVATFTNGRTPEEIHFDFILLAGRWLLDDVRSIKEPRWTLSRLLKCSP